MCVELMLNAVNLAFVALAQLYGVSGQVIVFFVMTVAAAEAAVGLAIIIAHLPPPADGGPAEHQPAQGLMHPQLHAGIVGWRRGAARCAGVPASTAPLALRSPAPQAPPCFARPDRAGSGVAASGAGVAASAPSPSPLASFLALRGAARARSRIVVRLWTWMPVGRPADRRWRSRSTSSSMVMMLVVTGVGSLIHLFSVGYMRDDPGYPRYFAYLNLFVFFMLVLVLGANYPGDVRRLGRRGTLLLPADRLLVQRQGQRRRRQEGVHRQPHRRLRLPGRDVPALARARARSTSPASPSGADRAGGGRRGGHRDHACSSSSAAPARARRSRSTSGCPTRWPARRRSPR